MADLTVKPTNGVSWGFTHKVVTADKKANFVVELNGGNPIDFELAVISILDGVVVVPTQDGATLTFDLSTASADDILTVIAQRSVEV